MKCLSILASMLLGLFFFNTNAAENHAFIYPALLKSGKNLLKSDLKKWRAKSIKKSIVERGTGSPFSPSDPTLLIKSADSIPNYWGCTTPLPGGRTYLVGAWVKNDNAKILFWFWGNYGKPVRKMNNRIYYFAGFNSQLKNHLSSESQTLLGGNPDQWHLCYRLVTPPASSKTFYLNMMIGAFFSTGNITIASPFIIDVTDVKQSGMIVDVKGEKAINTISLINLYNRDEIWSKNFDGTQNTFCSEIPDTDFRHGLNDKAGFNGFLLQVKYNDGSFASFTVPEEKSYKYQQ